MRLTTLIKYSALNVFLAVIYYELFLYLASLQGGGSIMLETSPFLIFGLIATSSIILTMAIYSIASRKNIKRTHGGITGTAAGVGTLIMGTGLCGCTTAFPLAIAVAFGVGSTGVYALGGFLKNYSTLILSVMIIINILIIAYYSGKLSKPGHKK